jgi:hypothetical protein
MFNLFYDEYTQRLEKTTLPFGVICHRPEDDPLFADNAEFNHATQGFGWSESTYVYTCGKWFTAPTGLDAVLLYHRSKPEKGKQTTLHQRGADLTTFAAGKYVDRIEIAHYMTLGKGSASPHDGTEDQIPSGSGPFDIELACIQSDGSICTRRVIRWSGKESDESSQVALLLNRPRYRVLPKVKVEEGGQVYQFTEQEIAQLETAIAEYKSITDLLQPTIENAVRYKYGEMSEGAWKLVAGTLGLSVKAVQKSKASHDEWWEGYARMHDGGDPIEK